MITAVVIICYTKNDIIIAYTWERIVKRKIPDVLLCPRKGLYSLPRTFLIDFYHCIDIVDIVATIILYTKCNLGRL